VAKWLFAAYCLGVPYGAARTVLEEALDHLGERCRRYDICHSGAVVTGHLPSVV